MTAARGGKNPAAPLPGGLRAKQRTAVVLAVLSGECPVSEASRRLGVTPNRYYGLERQGLEGMLQALDDVQVRQRTAAITREHARLAQEVLRLQALVRATHRAVSLPAPPTKAVGRRRKAAPRARKVIAQLRASAPDAPVPAPPEE
jgi:hypothetical protein